MHIRKAMDADIDAIVLIEKQGEDLWKRDFFSDELDKPLSLFFVAEIDKEVAGFIIIWVIAGEIQLHNIAVSQKYRRQRIGNHLLEFIETYSYGEKPNSIQLEVREGNTGARAFYETNGFKVIGKRPKYYNDESAVLMEKQLNA